VRLRTWPVEITSHLSFGSGRKSLSEISQQQSLVTQQVAGIQDNSHGFEWCSTASDDEPAVRREKLQS
jgi:hypothetical protein